MKKLYLFGGIVLAFAAAGTAGFLYLSQPPPSLVATPRRASERSAQDVAALRGQAEQGNAGAQLELGRLYAKGEQVTNSYREAAKWYEKAASQGNAEAELALGELCQAGRGMPKDVPRAIKLYRQAAEQGNAGAQYNLGFMYEAGQDVPTDQAQAAQWYRRAAEGGDPLAQYDLGQRYDLGVGVPVDRIESYKWLSLASAQGQADSPARLKTVKAKMTRAEIKEAKRRVAEFGPSKKPQAKNSLAGDGRRIVRLRVPCAIGHTAAGEWFSLSLRERAGVRGGLSAEGCADRPHPDPLPQEREQQRTFVESRFSAFNSLAGHDFFSTTATSLSPERFLSKEEPALVSRGEPRRFIDQMEPLDRVWKMPEARPGTPEVTECARPRAQQGPPTQRLRTPLPFLSATLLRPGTGALHFPNTLLQSAFRWG